MGRFRFRSDLVWIERAWLFGSFLHCFVYVQLLQVIAIGKKSARSGVGRLGLEFVLLGERKVSILVPDTTPTQENWTSILTLPSSSQLFCS